MGNTTSWGVHWSKNRCCLSSFTWCLEDRQRNSYILFFYNPGSGCLHLSLCAAKHANNKQTQAEMPPHQSIWFPHIVVDIISSVWFPPRPQPLMTSAQAHSQSHPRSHLPTHLQNWAGEKFPSSSLIVSMTAALCGYPSRDHHPGVHLH